MATAQDAAAAEAAEDATTEKTPAETAKAETDPTSTSGTDAQDKPTEPAAEKPETPSPEKDPVTGNNNENGTPAKEGTTKPDTQEQDKQPAPATEDKTAAPEKTDDPPEKEPSAADTESASDDKQPTEEPAEEGSETDKKSETPDRAVEIKVTEESPSSRVFIIALGIAALIFLPFFIGNFIAKKIRMEDYGWKLGLIFTCVAIGITICSMGKIHLGPDLAGGINLIYEVRETDESPITNDLFPKLIQALTQRVNPAGIKEVTIRKYGSRQIEIIIPIADPAEVQNIEELITTAGALEFRIVANSQDHLDLIEQANALPLEERIVQDDDGDILARWVKVDRKKFTDKEILESSRYATRRNSLGELEVLIVDDVYDVTGDYLTNASDGIDNRGGNAVNFSFNSRGAVKFGDLTSENAPEAGTGRQRQLGIVLDNTLISAPNLNEPITQGRGQISGNFTPEEVAFLVQILNAGSLPSQLIKTPISKEITDPLLGEDTIKAGKYSMIASMILVILFMLVYYRFSGVVACLALTLNLIFIIGVMIVVKAAFTLPGLAGLVLTVGMAVDANVLIFERIREELSRGAAMRMAIRNGFGRATTTIVDANLTTLITAVVLYVIGTDQIKGFSVTLILGILMSMFTAIFCSRVLFDIAERKRWLTELKMMRLLGQTNIDFISKRGVAMTFSLIIIVLGMVAVGGRGKDLLDIDFLGGSAITVSFKEQQNLSDVRAKAEEHYKDVVVVGVGGEGKNFKIQTLDRNLEKIQKDLVDAFGNLLRYHELDYSDLKKDPGKSDREAYLTTLTFTEPLKHDTVAKEFDEAFEELKIKKVLPKITNSSAEYLPGSGQMFDQWDVSLTMPEEDATALLEHVKAKFDNMPIFPNANTIGGQVASDRRVQAGISLFLCLLFIIGYIWLRFQRIMFGLAAVAALVHDVLVTLGAIAISAYIYNYAGFVASPLLIDPFKISLPIIAAFLTIIGYSLNDTIVVFDRIREVRGKSPDLTKEMVNTSLNQTLSRTVLTSLTTMIVVVILYFFGGPGIHAFAYALVIGVIVGTYSSIFIASPTLLWMSKSSLSDASLQVDTVAAGTE